MIMCQNRQGCHSAVNVLCYRRRETAKSGIVPLKTWRILLSMNIVEPCGGLLGMAKNQLSIATRLAAAFMLYGVVSVFSFSVAAEALSVEPETDADGTAVIRIADDVDDAGNDNDEQAAAVLSEEERLREQQLLQDAEALRAELARLSPIYGTYDPALIEVQQDLGRTYLDLQQYDNAVEHLMQALQLLRVNEGLYSERQISVLNQLIEANQGLQEWEEADDHHHLLFSVQSRLYEAGSEEQVDALIAFADWRVHAARQNLLARGGAQHNVSLLQDIQDQQGLALEAARERGHVRQQWEVLYTQALTDIELARQLNYRSLMDFAEPSEPRYVTRTVCRMVPDGPNGVRRVCWNQTVDNPGYYRAANDQRRSYLERARSRVQMSLRQLNELVAENPDFAREYEEDTERSLEAIQNVVADLQRDSRRATMRGW